MRINSTLAAYACSLTSQGGMDHCTAGMKALTCAQRIMSSVSGVWFQYALPPMMSGKVNGYPMTAEVRRLGMRLCRPLSTPQTVSLSPIRTKPV